MTLENKNDSNEVQILSAAENFTYFKEPLNEEEIINVMSDLKHRIFPRPFERLSTLRTCKDLVGAEIGVAGGGACALPPENSLNQEALLNRSL